MRVVENIEVIVNEKKVLDIVCNGCGKSFVPDYANTMQEFNLSFNYGSQWDGYKLNFDLCEICLEKIVCNFKIPPQVS